MGASNKNAQDNIQPKGNKKPLQVLHINKKDTQKKSQNIDNEQSNSQEEIKKENIAIKPQIIKDDSVKEIEDSNENTKDFDISQQDLTQQDLNRPINFPFFAELDTFSQLCLRINALALTVTIPSAFCSLITKTSISRPIENFSLKLVMTPKPHSFLGI